MHYITACQTGNRYIITYKDGWKQNLECSLELLGIDFARVKKNSWLMKVRATRFVDYGIVTS